MVGDMHIPDMQHTLIPHTTPVTTLTQAITVITMVMHTSLAETNVNRHR